MKRIIFMLFVLVFIVGCKGQITSNVVLEDIKVKTSECDDITLIFFQSNSDEPFNAGNKMICYEDLGEQLLFKYNIANAGSGDWNGVNIYIDAEEATLTVNLYNENQTLPTNGVIGAFYFDKSYGKPLRFKAVPVLLINNEFIECKDRILVMDFTKIEAC